jgi:leucyl-tRNA synthetase
MVCSVTYQRENGDWLFPQETRKKSDGKYEVITTGENVILGYIEKMSKSKKNVVDPDEIIKNYGADALRLFIVSDTPPDRDFLWSDEGLEGCWRFINRLWRLFVYAQSSGICAEECSKSIILDVLDPDIQKLYKGFHRTIKNVTDSLEERSMNKVVAHIRDSVNALYMLLEKMESHKSVFSVIIRDLLKLLAPIVPHICEEVWNMLGFKGLVLDDRWPIYEKAYLEIFTVDVAVQVNGKLRGIISVSVEDEEEKVLEQALGIPSVQNQLAGRTLKKKIFVKGKIVNFVV